MNDSDSVLEQARTAVLAFGTDQGPAVSVEPYWFDGSQLWFATSGDTAALLRDGPACAVPVAAAADSQAARAGERAVVVIGEPRVFGLHDPLGAVIHASSLAGAMAALAARWLPDAARAVPQRVRELLAGQPVGVAIAEGLRDRVPVRVGVRRVRPLNPPLLPPGAPPALPAELPAHVRRALAGRRELALILESEASSEAPSPGARRAAPRVLAAALGPGWALHTSEDPPLRDGRPAVVAAALDDRERGVTGCVIHGTVAGGALRPERVRWWDRDGGGSAEVAPPSSAIVLPD